MNFINHKRHILLFASSILLLALIAGAGMICDASESYPEKSAFERVCVYSDAIPEVKIYMDNGADDREDELYMFMPYRDMEWKWSIPDGIDILIDGEQCFDGDKVRFADPEEEHLITYTEKGQLSENKYLTFLYAEKMPFMNIDIYENELDKINEEEDPIRKGRAEIKVYDETGRLDSMASCLFGGHGNSTWQCSKKPYEMKFNKPVSILNMPLNTGWNLLANRMDCSNLKNRIVYEAAAETNLEFSVECEYINLYLNGSYQGLYLLTEKPNAKGVVEFGDDLEKENLSLVKPEGLKPVIRDPGTKEEIRYYDIPSPPDISGSYLLELEWYEKDMNTKRYPVESWFMTDLVKNEDGDEWLVVLKQPKIASLEEVEYIKNYIREGETAIYCKDGIDPETGVDYRERIDMYSWAMCYLFMDFFANHDTSAGSIYYYKKRGDPLVYNGPVWDYDKSMTGDFYNTESFPWYGKVKNIIYGRLSEQPDFHDKVVENYKEELSPIVDNILKERIPEWLDQIETSVIMDENRWSRGDGYETDQAAVICEWLEKRKELFDAVWIRNEESPYSENI